MDVLGGTLLVAAISGCAVTLLAQRQLWIVWALAGLGFVMAWSYVAGADPDRFLDGLGRLILVSFPLAGWLLGITATSVWVVGRRSGEKSKQRTGAAPT